MHYSFSQEFSTDSKIVFCFLSNMIAMTLIVGCFNVASNDFDKLSVSKFSRTIAIIMCAIVRSRIRETGGMWPFARQRCCPPGGYWYQSKALHLPDLITLTVRLQRCN